MTGSLCFVLIPTGKVHVEGVLVDYDALYRDLLEPAIRDAQLEPTRSVSDETHTPTVEGLLLAEYAIVDLSVASANVFYQLGIRDGLRHGAVLTYPRDVSPPRGTPPSELFLYAVSEGGAPDIATSSRRDLTRRLERSGGRSTENTLLEAVERPLVPPVDHTVTDVFRERVRYSTQWKKRLKEIRKGDNALATLRSAEQELELAEAEAGVVIDLLLSYRALSGWGDMIVLVDRMAAPLARSTMVQEQLGFALNRAGKQEQAIDVLKALIERRGPSSETCGILGRVYKDQWMAAKKSGDTALAQARLEAAIEAYLQGFQADWRDPYPGINAATLMEVHVPPDERQNKILPLVVYATERRVEAGLGDYWDLATLVEAAVLAKNRVDAEAAFPKAEALVRERWEPETTAKNLGLIRDARKARGVVFEWADAIQEKLERRGTGK